MNPWSVFVESNTSGTGRLFAQAARSLGCEPVVLAADPGRYDYIKKDDIAAIQTDCSDGKALEDAIARLARRKAIAGIYSSSEYFIHVAARMAKSRGLSGPDPSAIELCRDKRYQRQCLHDNGIRVPAFVPATSREEALDALSTIELPVIVKPAFGTGSVGVRLCRTREEVSAHAQALLALRTNERGMPVPAAILVEEYLRGPEYSVETFGRKIVGITQKHVSAEPVFVEIGHDFPAGVASETAAEIHDIVSRSLTAMNLGWGPCHLELRVTRNGPAIVEINPRLAGGFIPELVRMASGIDMVQATVSEVIGRAGQARAMKDKHASIRFLVPQYPGTISRINEIDCLPNVDVVIYRSVGDRVSLQGDFRDRIGHVIAYGSTAEEATGCAEHALKHLHVELVQ